jgi:hypothetical protein
MTIYSSLRCALALAAIVFASAANAHHTLNPEAIEELLEHPAMIDNADLSLDPATQTRQIEAIIDVVFRPLEPFHPGIVNRMTSISDCESWGGGDGMIMHIDPQGDIVENPDPESSATGALMVLLKTHRSNYAQLGLNPLQVSENIVFGRVLLEERISWGTWIYEPWKQCA